MTDAPVTKVVQLVPRGMQSGLTYHLGIVKPLLLELLRTHGACEILKNWHGTDAEAIAAIEADPRNVFVLDPTCTRQHPHGECEGHSTDGQ